MLGSKLAHRALTRLWRDYTTTRAGGSLLTFGVMGSARDREEGWLAVLGTKRCE